MLNWLRVVICFVEIIRYICVLLRGSVRLMLFIGVLMMFFWICCSFVLIWCLGWLDWLMLFGLVMLCCLV